MNILTTPRYDNYILITDEYGNALYRSRNFVLNTWRDQHAKWVLGQANGGVAPADFKPPNYIGAGIGSGGNDATRTKLVTEINRRAITSRVLLGNYEVRLLVPFARGVATGDWTEIGLWYTDSANVFVKTVSSCDSLTHNSQNWTTSTGGSLSVEAVDYKEGLAALENFGNAAVPFEHTALNVGTTGKTNTSTTLFLQLWYYIDSTANLNTGITVELASSATNDTNEISWTIAKASLSNGWNFLRLKFSDGTNTSPAIAMDSISRFTLRSAKAAGATNVTERLDGIELIDDGVTGQLLFSRVVISPAHVKANTEARNVLWFIRVQ